MEECNEIRTQKSLTTFVNILYFITGLDGVPYKILDAKIRTVHCM